MMLPYTYGMYGTKYAYSMEQIKLIGKCDYNTNS